jgi:hypothetical protein
MGVLKDFERRLEGAVEGFFARAFGAGLQPVELAKALQRYAADRKMVAEDGVVVPNAYRFSISPKDHERLQSYGEALTDELTTVLHRSADERGWHLRGPARVEIVTDADVATGRYELAGKVEPGPMPSASAGRTPSGSGAAAAQAVREPRPSTLMAPPPVLRDDNGTSHALTGSRLTVGRDPACDIVLSDPTVSREHAALVRRGDTWWVLDLGSTNGTRVRGVQAAEQPIAHGDEVAFGEAVLTFDEGG